VYHSGLIHKDLNKLTLSKSCWFNKNSICKITRNLLLIIIINVTPNTGYTINEVAISVSFVLYRKLEIL
jgi:hypothetical protein